MGTLSAVLLGLIALVAALFGAHGLGKSKGKEIQKTEDDQKAAKEQTEILKSEKTANEQSQKISNQVNREVDSAGPGGAAEWLRKNANRDNK